MKTERSTYILVLAGILITFASILLSSFIAEAAISLNGINSMDKVAVTVSSRATMDYFSLQDVKDIQMQLKKYNIAYSGASADTVKHGINTYRCKVNGVSSNYNTFVRTNIKYGSFFNVKNEESYVAVIDADFAREIFNTDKAVGLYVNLRDKEFKIIGVINNKRNIIERLAYDGRPNVYVPVNVFMDFSEDQGIQFVQLSVNSDGNKQSINEDNEDKVKSILQLIGKKPYNYNVRDYRKIAFEQKSLLLVFIIGFIVLVIIVCYIVKEAKELYSTIKKDLRSNFFFDTIKVNLSGILKFSIKAVLASIMVYILWKLIKFKLYISPEFIPDDLTDISYYLKLAKRKTEMMNFSTSNNMSLLEHEMNIAGRMINCIFYIGIIIGLPFMYMGFKQIRYFKISVIKLAIYSYLCFVITLLISIFSAFSLGLTFEIRVGILEVTCIFIALNIIAFGINKNKIEFLQIDNI